MCPYFAAISGGNRRFTCGYAAWIRVSGWALRAAAMMCIVMALAQPSFRQRETQPLDDVVLIVEDRTASQALGSRAEQTDRVGQLLRDQLTPVAKFNGANNFGL